MPGFRRKATAPMVITYCPLRFKPIIRDGIDIRSENAHTG